jgi:hypothetical protein
MFIRPSIDICVVIHRIDREYLSRRRFQMSSLVQLCGYLVDTMDLSERIRPLDFVQFLSVMPSGISVSVDRRCSSSRLSRWDLGLGEHCRVSELRVHFLPLVGVRLSSAQRWIHFCFLLLHRCCIQFVESWDLRLSVPKPIDSCLSRNADLQSN